MDASVFMFSSIVSCLHSCFEKRTNEKKKKQQRARITVAETMRPLNATKLTRTNCLASIHSHRFRFFASLQLQRRMRFLCVRYFTFRSTIRTRCIRSFCFRVEINKRVTCFLYFSRLALCFVFFSIFVFTKLKKKRI